MEPLESEIIMLMERLEEWSEWKNETVLENYADSKLLKIAAKAMTQRMEEASIRGKKGWWNEYVCSLYDLQEELEDAVANQDMVSVMNYAAMIYIRKIAGKK